MKNLKLYKESTKWKGKNTVTWKRLRQRLGTQTEQLNLHIGAISSKAGLVAWDRASPFESCVPSSQKVSGFRKEGQEFTSGCLNYQGARVSKLGQPSDGWTEGKLIYHGLLPWYLKVSRAKQESERVRHEIMVHGRTLRLPHRWLNWACRKNYIRKPAERQGVKLL